MVCSEILYYWSAGLLERSLGDLGGLIGPGGSLVAVHWRPRTRSYPQLGDEVHDRLSQGLEALVHARSVTEPLYPTRPLGPAGVRQAELVIVGGGAAGLAAARGYRDAGGDGEVVMLAGEPRPPYRRPPLTKEYLRGELDAAELPLEAPEWFAQNRVRIETGTWAVKLDPGARTVTTEEQGELSYDRCVLATGARPKRPGLPGADDPAVHTVRRVEDSDCLRQFGPGDWVVVVGSGFIGCEAAASLAMRGVEVELVTDERQPQAARLGDEVGARIAGWLTEDGVTLRLGRPVAEIEPGGRALSLEGGQRIEASAVVLALGISPTSSWAERRDSSSTTVASPATRRAARAPTAFWPRRRGPARQSHRRPADHGPALGRGPCPGRGGRAHRGGRRGALGRGSGLLVHDRQAWRR